MTKWGWLPFCALLWAMGMAGAGDFEYLALKGGESEQGRLHMNGFVPQSDVAAARRPARHDKYLEWKNECVAVPTMVKGQSLVAPRADGFLRVSPYLAKPEPAGDGFLEMLAGETHPNFP